MNRQCERWTRGPIWQMLSKGLPTAMLMYNMLPAAQAQSTADADALALEEVIVTATRRDERLLDIPQAVSALREAVLRDGGFDSLSDFAGQVPSLNFTERGPGKTSINIRGVSADPGTASVSTVGIYVDDTPITNDTQDSQAYVSTFDMQQVEVLRGPQGTLYGEGAMGGVIRYISNKPSTNGVSGQLDLSAASIRGGDEDYAVQAALNIPLADQLALRAVGFLRREGGYIDNPVIGEDNFNSADISGGRISLRYTPTERLALTAMAMINRIDVDGDNITRGGGENEFLAEVLNPRSDDYDLYSLTLNYDFDAFQLTSVSSYSERDASLFTVDSDIAIAGFVAPFQAIFSDDPVNSSIFQQIEHNESFSQEIRLVSNTDGRLDWTAGVWYRDADFTDQFSRLTTPAPTYGGAGDISFLLGLPPGSIAIGPNPLGGELGSIIPGNFSTDRNTASFENIAAFGELSIDLGERFEVLLGGRWFEEKRSQFSPVGTGGQNDISDVIATLSGRPTAVPTDQEFTISTFTPKLTASYRPAGDDTLLYFTYATGVRSGGRNDTSVVGLTPRGRECQEFYNEDKTANFELGAKSSLLGGRVSLQGAAFYTDWKDLQVLFFDALTFNSCVDNAASAHTAGLEVELAAQLTDRLSVSLGGTYIEAELDEDIPGGDSATAVIAKGTDLPNVADYKIGAALRYERPAFANWNAVFAANFNAVGKSVAALEPGVRGNLEQPAYQILNARIGLESDRASAFLTMDNVTDEYAVLADDTFGGIHRNKPRTIGLKLHMEF